MQLSYSLIFVIKYHQTSFLVIKINVDSVAYSIQLPCLLSGILKTTSYNTRNNNNLTLCSTLQKLFNHLTLLAKIVGVCSKLFRYANKIWVKIQLMTNNLFHQQICRQMMMRINNHALAQSTAVCHRDRYWDHRNSTLILKIWQTSLTTIIWIITCMRTTLNLSSIQRLLTFRMPSWNSRIVSNPYISGVDPGDCN